MAQYGAGTSGDMTDTQLAAEELVVSAAKQTVLKYRPLSSTVLKRQYAAVEHDGDPLSIVSLVTPGKERCLDTKKVFLYNNKPIQPAACRRAGITGLRVHDLRHTASTNLRRAGVDTATAMKIVGHKSDWMHRRYNTIEPGDLQKAAEKLHMYRVNTPITPQPIAVLPVL